MLSVVDKMGFRRLIGVLEPSYEISSRHHITDTVLPKHEFVKKHIHSLVQDISAFSFTTYIWTSSVSPVSLIRLIVQWIDEDFNPHRVILHGKQFRGSLTSHAIAGAFDEMLRYGELRSVRFTLCSATMQKHDQGPV